MKKDLSRLSIGPGSQEMYRGLIKTMPIEPHHYAIILQADGITVPLSRNRTEMEQYLAVCAHANIAPLSELHLTHSRELNTWFPDRSVTARAILEPDEFKERLSKKELVDVVRKVWNGGRVNTLVVSGGHGTLATLNQGFLETLHQDGYQIHAGDIWLTDNACARLSFGYDLATGHKVEGIVMDTLSLHDENLREYLVRWLEGLEKEHGRK